jgi:uncharacterized protein YbjQ (UPF0145 family)
MADQWYVSRGDKPVGPYTVPQLQQMAGSGQLKPSDALWKEGMQSWIPASSIPGVFPELIVTTGNEVAGYTITRYLGIVRGIVVRSPNMVQGLLGGLKQAFAGGNIESYAQVCEEARSEAFRRMARHAAQLGADAVISMRYDATEFSETATEVLAYGTAVKLTKSQA